MQSVLANHDGRSQLDRRLGTATAVPLRLRPQVAGVLGTRWLLVQVVGLTDGFTGVRADAQVVWIIPRPAGENVPESVRELDITRGRPGHAPSLSLRVTNWSKVRKIVSMIDQLPTAQPRGVEVPQVQVGRAGGHLRVPCRP